MAASFIAAKSWDGVAAAEIRPLAGRWDAAGQSLAVFTDTPQPRRNIDCRATQQSGKVETIAPAALEMTNTTGAKTWHLLAVLYGGANGLTVQCTPRDRAVDHAQYGAATVDSFEYANIGNGIGLIGTLAAVVLIGWTFITRRKRRKAIG